MPPPAGSSALIVPIISLIGICTPVAAVTGIALVALGTAIAAPVYAGKIVEHGAVRDLFRDPKHPYTHALLGSMPKLGSKEPLFAIPGQPPNLAQLPSGCAFQPRCVHAMPRCAMQEPDDSRIGPNWTAKCWLVDEQLKGQYVSATA